MKIRQANLIAGLVATGCILMGQAATELGQGDMSRAAGAYDAATDYIVKGAHQLSSPRDAQDFTFGGKSLTLGDGSTVGYLVMRTKWDGSVGRVMIPDLRLNAGSGSWCGTGSQTSDLNANITVLAPVDKPAYFQMYSGRPYYLEGTISGETGTALKILDGDGTKFYLNSSCADFKGSLILEDTSSGGWKLDCYAKNGASVGFGSKLDAFNEKAIWFKNHARLRFQSAFEQTDTEGDNRGIWLENGGCLQVGGTSTLYSPIAGTGDLFVMDSGMTLRYGGELRSGGLEIQGKLQFLQSFRMSEKASFKMSAASAELKTMSPEIHPVIYNFSYNGGTLMIPASTTDSGYLDFYGSFAANGNKITIGLDSVPTFTGKLRVKALSLPLGERPLTEEDFVLSDGGATSAVEAILVETDQSTLRQSVYMIVSQRVNVNENKVAKGGTALCNTAEHWSNGEVVSAGNDYFVKERNLRSGEMSDSYEFPGDSLTFYNPFGTLSDWIRLESKHGTFTCQNLWLYHSTGLMLSGYGVDPCTQTFSGNISVNAPRGYVIFAGYVNRRGVIESAVSGKGGIYFIGPATFELKADNSGYAGSLRLTDGVTLKVSEERNLGGTPTACTDAYPLNVEAGSMFRPSQSMTIAERKMRIDGGTVQTDEGVELISRASVMFGAQGGDAVKCGNGIWTLAAAGENETGARVVVTAGALKVAQMAALGTSRVVLQDDGVLMVDVNTEDEALKTYGAFLPGGLESTGERITVRIDKPMTRTKVPVLTVENAALDEILSKLDVKVGKFGRLKNPVVVPVEIGGKAYSCIKVNGQEGLIVTIR